MGQVLYYFLVIPLSKLPFSVLYLLSDVLHFIIYKLIPYRRDVVIQNMTNSFPDKSSEEIEELCNKFYRHFCDLIFESIALFDISEEEVRKRFKAKNIDALNDVHDKEGSAIIASGHYNNWEMAAVAINLQVKHQVDGVYTPLSNSFLNRKFKTSREKFGVKLSPKKMTTEMFENHEGMLTATGFGIDQCPRRSTKRAYWTNFLGQETAVMFGTEKYAKAYNYSVVFMRISKVKRGFYEFEFELITDAPAETEYGEITEAHTSLLEQQILEAPEYWLWTHKRWKLKPEMINGGDSIQSTE